MERVAELASTGVLELPTGCNPKVIAIDRRSIAANGCVSLPYGGDCFSNERPRVTGWTSNKAINPLCRFESCLVPHNRGQSGGQRPVNPDLAPTKDLNQLRHPGALMSGASMLPL